MWTAGSFHRGQRPATVQQQVARDCYSLRVFSQVSLSLMALTNALCVCRSHCHYMWIAALGSWCISACWCVCLYVPHDAMSYDATRWSVMPCDTCSATWCSAMRRDGPARCPVMPCISLPCPAMLCNALCDATRCHAMPHST